MDRITILTHPIGDNRWGNMGHAAVTQSLLRGFDRIGFDNYIFQPESESQLTDIVHVIHGPGPCQTLQYALKLKSEGIIKRITAGPNVFVFPFEYNYLIDDPAIEKYLVASNWVKEMFSVIDPNCSDKLRIWPCGVDEKLTTLACEKDYKAIIYIKGQQSDHFYMEIEEAVAETGFEPIIFRYGSYGYNEYIEALKEAAFMVAVSDAETQGLYLAEAWALDVPTLCYDEGTYTWKSVVYGEDICYPATSSCPYLSEATGVRFRNIEQLKSVLDNIAVFIKNTSPRKWVVDNMTDGICARYFLDTIMEQN